MVLLASRALFALVLASACAGAAASAQGQPSPPQSLGVYGPWGAFRDTAQRRCYALARPGARARGTAGSAYASFGYWPAQRVRSQFYLRLSRPRDASAELSLTIDGRRFILVGNGIHGWAADARMDAAIIAAVRSSMAMAVSSSGQDGRAIADAYRLRGAASAIDAAALGCAGLR